MPTINWSNIVKSLSLHAAAVIASAVSIANSDLTKVQNYVVAVAPTAIAAAVNFVRQQLHRL